MADDTPTPVPRDAVAPADAAALSRAFVAAGIAQFAATHLAQPGPVFAHLLAEAEPLPALLGLPDDADWPACCAALATRAPALDGALGRLLQDLELQLPEWFALALAGETEASHLLNLALAELQTPGQTRPTLHLVQALADALFGAVLRPLAWPNHRLVRAGVLALQPGAAALSPLPASQLAMPPALWALLGGDRSAWPDTRPLPPARAALPQALLQRLDALAALVRSGRVRHLVLRGAAASTRAAAAAFAERLQRPGLVTTLPAWRQNPALAAACRYAGWLAVLELELGPGDRERLGEQPLAAPTLLLCGSAGSVEAPALAELELPPLSAAERRAAWRAVLPEAGDEAVAVLARDALLDGPAIEELGQRVAVLAASSGAPLAGALREARALHGSERLRQLAEPVWREVGADALVLPAGVARQFDALLARCRAREGLAGGLGASLQEPGTGVRALFCGDSGAGKTLAAHRLASALGAPLFRVDLSAVMNKYIGESEKNLGRLLDEAAALDALLLLDEADSLFGRRGEARDSGERYANMLTNFLLTRIERHPGIVLLTSNARGRIDAAFTRRFDAVLEFPPPGTAERLRLWQSHLGARAPAGPWVEVVAAYCDFGGGHIRNAVLHAAALDGGAAAADDDAARALSAECLTAALLEEYRKLGRVAPAQVQSLRQAGAGP